MKKLKNTPKNIVCVTFKIYRNMEQENEQNDPATTIIENF